MALKLPDTRIIIERLAFTDAAVKLDMAVPREEPPLINIPGPIVSRQAVWFAVFAVIVDVKKQLQQKCRGLH